MREIELSLDTKTWLVSIVLNLSRILYPIFGVAHWQTAYKNRHKNERLDQERVDLLEPYVKGAVIGMVALGVLLDILVWKKRNFARVLIYYELASNMLQTLVPFDYGDTMMVTLFM